MLFPKVTIIMPVFNAENYVGQAIESVILQSYKNWELIIVNDGSTDYSANIINNYLDPRIIVFHQENIGVSEARNKGLSEMKGDFFCFLDADDTLPVESLKARLDMFTQGLEFVDGKVNIMNRTMDQVISTWTPTYRGNPYKSLLNIDGKSFFGLTWMIRRNSFNNYYFMNNLTHGEDLLFYMNISHLGQYDFTNEPILNYRKGHESAMKNIKALENGYFLVYNELLKNNNISTEESDIFKSRLKAIMLKTYIKKIMFYSVFKLLFRKI